MDVIEQRRRDLGGGMEVGRVLPYRGGRMVGPFIFFDHMGPVQLARGLPREFDVRPHPHIGLSTVTYLFSGEVMHRDSLGSEQSIHPGEVNWMVAGSGITHSERFERARAQGDLLHGIQSWVALPREYEESAPQFAHHAGAELPLLAEGGVTARLIAGEAFGVRARTRVHSPLFYVHWELQAGASIQLPAEFPERALYIAAGTVQAEGRSWRAGRMLVFAPREPAVV
ncbi:MAG TPA: pirin family protein, partial [Steroidobacteraceae bacterium]|nr:pirin family protein [Steroidobacteraceae bacterium]